MKTKPTSLVLVICCIAVSGAAQSLAGVTIPDGRILVGGSDRCDSSESGMILGLSGEPLLLQGESLQEPVPPPEERDSMGTWYALGSGLNGEVLSVAVSGSDVYVGGTFTQAGGISANHVARWDGDSWSALGSGLGSTVQSIAVSGSDVYVGGAFTQAGGNPANRIARWDGSSWSALGSGLNNIVSTIAVNGSNLVVGGAFTSAGAILTNYIACWDGSVWSTLGSGLSAAVIAASVGADVYVGGLFTQAGGIPANRAARWDGSAWSALGSGLDDEVYAIEVSGSDVYVGGAFTQAGGISANRVARWVEGSTETDQPSGTVVPGGTPALLASPNPMTTGTTLSFQSIGLSPLTLEIYDPAGRSLWESNLGSLPVGSHTRFWDGCDGRGSALASGVYFVRLTSTELRISTPVVLVR